jgi:hypothetical protein
MTNIEDRYRRHCWRQPYNPREARYKGFQALTSGPTGKIVILTHVELVLRYMCSM